MPIAGLGTGGQTMYREELEVIDICDGWNSSYYWRYLLIVPLLLVGASVFYLGVLKNRYESWAQKVQWGYYKSHSAKESPPKYKLTYQKPDHWVDLKQMSPWVSRAIVASEDSKFYLHKGFDIVAIAQAIEDSYLRNKRIRGASTISQQMVKNVFLTHKRSIWRKIHEAFLVHEIEKVTSKDKILEVYLNVIEFGPNIYGIKEASKYYFRKHPRYLTAKESAFLAMLLPNPKIYSKSFRQGYLTRYARKKMKNILRSLWYAGSISKWQYRRANLQTFSWERKAH